jgi:hypothetical protein
MPALLRDNDADPRVARDIELLSAAYSEEAIADAAVDAEQARERDLETLLAVYGEADAGSTVLPVVVRHLRRYRKPYILAAVVLGVLLFRQPVPAPIEAAEEATQIGGQVQVGASDLAPAGSSESFAPAPASPLDLGGPVVEEPPVFEAPLPATAAPLVVVPPALRIEISGYASALGGTPIEQAPPGNGLPVESTAGSVTKYSFVRLSGGGTLLRLRMLSDDGASLNDAAAGVEVCHLTSAGWKPQRGVARSDAPAYDGDCMAGTRQGDVWSFRFALDNPVGGNGWAIVPVTTANGTFRVTFAPQAVG